MKEVILLNMPFVSISRPAIGISILKARLAEEGIQCDVAYPNLLFAEMVGVENYHLIDERISLSAFAGDWLFAQYLFGEKLDLSAYIRTLQNFLKNEEEFQRVLDLRKAVGPFLWACMDRLEIKNYRLVGFTTTFQQNLASLALAWEIKKNYPEKRVVFGGGNCEGPMGYQLHQSFPWIDYVCRGESEGSLPGLSKAIQSGQSVDYIKGIVYRNHTGSIPTDPVVPLEDLDQLPCPDYDDYFEALKDSPLEAHISPIIPVENSRGCWWGDTSHCTFCGLNGEKITFRSKSPARILEELRILKNRYKVSSFVAVDNIMSMRYFEEVLPRLKEEALGISLFYETKANLKKEHVKWLAEAGINSIQPGIESLNTHILGLMRKGTTALQNIQLLKWCSQYGVNPAWNLLYGFPGETAEDYEQMEEWMDALHHLTPPSATGQIRLDRFSPYFENPQTYGLRDIRPFSMYNLIYPLPPYQITDLAYFFEYSYTDHREPLSYAGKILEKIEAWKRSDDGALIKQYGNDPELLITDTRPNRRHSQVALKGLQREIYDYCDTAKSFQGLMDFARLQYEVPPDFQSWLQGFLDQMVDWKCMIRENDHYLSLAIGEKV